MVKSIDMRNWTEASIDKLRERGLRVIDTRYKVPAIKAPKYRNKKTEVNGIVFDSAKEAKRYKELLILLKAGEIGFLEQQVPYELNTGGTHSVVYICDFKYMNAKTGETIIEDTKGFRTKEYLKKRRLMKKVHGIVIKEI